jgi:hypothetical protein
MLATWPEACEEVPQQSVFSRAPPFRLRAASYMSDLPPQRFDM